MKSPETNDPLDALLAADADEEMRPGFDTRFQARLAEMKDKGAKKRFWGWTSLVAAGLTATAALAVIIPKTPRNEEAVTGVEIAYEYELYDDYDVVKNLPDLEVLELLASADAPKTDGVPQ